MTCGLPARCLWAAALGSALSTPSRADPSPALGAGASVLVIEEEELGSQMFAAAALSGEVVIPVGTTRWQLVPAATVGLRVGTQPVIGTLAETIAVARPVGPVSARVGFGPMQMVVEDSGRARLVGGYGACAGVQYQPWAALALVV